MPYALHNNFISKKELLESTKLTVYKTTYVPAITNGCESWPLTVKQHSKLEATEMVYLRKLEGKTKRGIMRNQTIRAVLKIETLQHQIETTHLRWFGHVYRMEEETIPKKVWQAPEGKRLKERPRQP